MRSTALLMMIAALGLSASCEKPDDCSFARVLYYGSAVTVDWLAANDPEFLKATLTHNEQVVTICGGS